MSFSTSTSSSSSRLSSGNRPAPFYHSILSSHPPEPLYQVKLLSALRSGELSRLLYSAASAARLTYHPTLGDPAIIHPFLAGLGKDHDGENDLGAAALHLGVRCASGVPLCSFLAPLVLIRSSQRKQSPFYSPTSPFRQMLSTPRRREQPLSI